MDNRNTCLYKYMAMMLSILSTTNVVPMKVAATQLSTAKSDLLAAEKIMKGTFSGPNFWKSSFTSNVEQTKARELLEHAAQVATEADVKAWANIKLALFYCFGWSVQKNDQTMRDYIDKAKVLNNNSSPDINRLIEILSDTTANSWHDWVDKNFGGHFFQRKNDNNGMRTPPLHTAILEKKREVVELLLLAMGANPGPMSSSEKAKEVDKSGRTALHCAIASFTGVDFREMVNLLIEKGASVNAQDADGLSPLHYAVAKGDRLVVEMLIGKGANVNVVSKLGLTLLHVAAENNDTSELLEFLLTLRSETITNALLVKTATRTVLHCAAAAGKDVATSFLLAHAADPNIADLTGITPLHAAVDSKVVTEGRVEVVRLLLAKGAQPNAADIHLLKTPLHWACYWTAMYQGKQRDLGVKIVKLLLDAGADRLAKDKKGEQPIMPSEFKYK